MKIQPGERFGRLVVLGEAEPLFDPTTHKKQSVALCRCDCGETLPVRAASLKSGNTRSCGCLRKRRPEQRVSR